MALPARRLTLLLAAALVLALHWLVLAAASRPWARTPQPPAWPAGAGLHAGAQPGAAATQARLVRVSALQPKPAPRSPRPQAAGAHTRPAAAPVPAQQSIAAGPDSDAADLAQSDGAASAANPNPHPADADAGASQTPAADASGAGTVDRAPGQANPRADPASAAPEPAPADRAVQDDTAAGIHITLPAGSASAGGAARAPPVRIPAPMRLSYQVSGQAGPFGYRASAELLWQHDGSRYRAAQQISALLAGARRQSSVGSITPQGLQPERFSDQRARGEQAADFDQAAGRVRFGADLPGAAIGAGAQDRLSVFIQLGALLAADPALRAPGSTIALSTAGARSAERWTFSVLGSETLELPAGSLQTVKLQRLPRSAPGQQAELWLAPALAYLPARIRITQANGDHADLRLLDSSAP